MQHKTIRGILFDKDGTLLHYEDTWGNINRKAASYAAHGDPDLTRQLLTVAGVDPLSGMTRSGSALAAGNTAEIAELWKENGSPQPIDKLMVELDRIFSGSMLTAKAVPGTLQLLALLKERDIIVGIASSDSEAAIHAFAQSTDIAPYIDFIVGYDSGFGHKPSSGMLDAFCRVCNLDPADVLVVGDNPQDMMMARAGHAGIAVGVLTGTGIEEELADLADLVMPDITGLSGFLQL